MNSQLQTSVDALNAKLKSLAQKERELLHEILLTIQLIDTRRVYLSLGFPSLFDYLVKAIGYSEGAAQRRIDAARLFREAPQLSSQIQSGQISLSQVSLVQKAIRQVSKTTKQKVTSQDKQTILKMISKKNHHQTQKTVAEFFDLPILQIQKQVIQADSSVRLELTFSQEQYEKLQKAKSLLSNSVPSGDLAQVIEHLSDRILRKNAGRVSSEKNTLSNAGKPTATMAVKSPQSKTVPAKIRKQVFETQGGCQFKNAQTNQKCGGRWQLQIDHIQPRWAGGTHQPENLRILCGKHNRLVYQQQAGIVSR